MIKQIIIENFKSFRKIDLTLGKLNLFIGANSSGKSNFFDALRVVQGLGYGFTIREILDGKPKSASSIEWEGIRGGSLLAGLRGGKRNTKAIRLEMRLNFPLKESWRSAIYECEFIPLSSRITQETLKGLAHDWETVYSSPLLAENQSRPILTATYNRHKGRGKKPNLYLDSSRAGFTQMLQQGEISEAHQKLQPLLMTVMGNMQRIDPLPDILRDYSQAHTVQRMGERGENFAALVQAISENQDTKEAYLAWLREMRPAEVNDLKILSGALGEPLFALVERGKEYPAPVLSDGTLRFAAIAAAFFQPDMPGILTIEEIEKGIHDSRLRLLVELLKSPLVGENVQVMATTHSRSVLDWLEEEDYAFVFFCHRDPDTGESTIRPLAEIPHLLEAARERRLGDLLAENWLEAAV